MFAQEPGDTRRKRPPGVSPSSLLAGEGFTLKDFKEVGCSAFDVKDLVKDMLGGEEAAELKSIGFEAADLKSAGFGAPELRRGGFNLLQLRQGGFSPEDLTEAGFSSSWVSADFQRDEEAARALVEECFPLHKAAAMKGQEGALIVLMETVEADHEDSSSGKSAMHIAAGEGNEEALIVLVQAGAAVDKQDGNGANLGGIAQAGIHTHAAFTLALTY